MRTRLIWIGVPILVVIALFAGWRLFSHEPRPYMVASAERQASEAGVEILRQGGNALDAAIAVEAVLGLIEPQSSGLGGGAYLLYWDAGNKALTSYDGRETAPHVIDPGAFLDADGKERSYIDAMLSGQSVGTPGLVKMLWLAHQKHGRLAWKDLFAPAIRLANTGFPVSPRLAGWLKLDPALAKMPGADKYFYRTDASGARMPLVEGDILKNPAYAQTLELIAGEGPDGFYKGPVAQSIVDAVTNAPRRPGALTLDDLRNYEAKERAPVCGPYRAFRVCGMGPSSSGGVTTLQILGILQSFDMGAIRPLSLEAVHFMSEASKLAFADRNLYLGDPDVHAPPVAQMLAPAYLRSRADLIDPSRTMGQAKPGVLPEVKAEQFAPNSDISLPSTSHFSIVDGDGNAIAMTASIEGPFGSHLMASGFLLNNELTDFSAFATDNGRPVANAVAPGKRPLSSMSPTIVFDKEGALYATLGSPNGTRIIGYVSQMLIALIDWHMGVQQAVDLPHVVDMNGPLELEEGTSVVALEPTLRQLGHEVVITKQPSGIQAIVVTPQGLQGAADPRREGVVLDGKL
ncbi:MAG: gamma-glutamyltransferase [Parvibaculaceae bacterium]|nr:gamma-glutamyltransferase [Parvibaculaceae bacterium]